MLAIACLNFFIENLDGYPCLIPLLFDDPAEDLSHLKFQNGTVWRWNRPIIGTNSSGTPHLRLEHRVMASGPSIVDIVANMVFYVGLTESLAQGSTPPHELMDFDTSKLNFYECAKNGLNSRIKWAGAEVDVQELILEKLLPAAKKSLAKMGVDSAEIEYYLDEIIHQRVLNGQNGAYWQKYFIDCHGKDFQALTEKYMEHQNSGKPVHLWTI